MTDRKSIHNDIISEMATMLYMDRIASELEEMDQAPTGKRYEDLVGETPIVALYKASEIAGAIEQSNAGASIIDLYTNALQAEGLQDSPALRKEFGETIALQSLGHGVSWFDNHAKIPLEFPFYLENDITLGKADFRSFIGFDETKLSGESLERFQEAPEHAEINSFFHFDKMAGIAKAAIIDANDGDFKNRQVAIDSLLVNAYKNVPAMCLAHKLAGALYEANRNTIYQLTLCTPASETMPEKYAITNLELQKFASNANPNAVKLGMAIYDWAVKGATFNETLGFEKPVIDLTDLENIKKSASLSKSLGQSPSP